MKPADKDGAVVVWSKHNYLLGASNQLCDTNVYCKSNFNTLQKASSKIKSVLRDTFNLKGNRPKNHELFDSQKTTSWKVLLTS